MRICDMKMEIDEKAQPCLLYPLVNLFEGLLGYILSFCQILLTIIFCKMFAKDELKCFS